MTGTGRRTGVDGGGKLIQILLAHAGRLARRALAAVLAAEDDLEVVAEAGDRDEVVPAARRLGAGCAQVAVLDLDLIGTADVRTVRELRRDPRCRILILLDRSRSPSVVGRALQDQPSAVGFVSKETSPARLVEAIRCIARGEPVLDPELALAALARPDGNPFTCRELEVLALAAEGVPVRDIANRLFLANGTVRNHLSRILAKTGARTRIEAIRTAQHAGWL